VAFADGQAIVLGAGECDSGADVLEAFFEMARRTLRQVRKWVTDKAIFVAAESKSIRRGQR
jgi:hypothetical protein